MHRNLAHQSGLLHSDVVIIGEISTLAAEIYSRERNGTPRCRNGEIMKKTIIYGVMAVCLAGCSSIPRDPAKLALYYADRSKAELVRGDLLGGFWDMTRAIDRPGGPEAMRAVLVDPIIRTKMLQAIDKESASTMGFDSAKKVSVALDKIAQTKILSDSELQAAQEKFTNHIRSGNRNGEIFFVISSDLAMLPQINTPEQMQIVYARTLKAYQDKSFAPRDLGALVSYVQANPGLTDSFKAALPSMNVRASELDQIALIDPSYANHRKAQLTMKAHLSVKNADRLFADDVGSRLSHDVYGVTWVPSEQPGALELVIERVRDNEKVLPTESRTITYSYYQVDVLSAALLMPKNASYLFDMKTSGAELDYGYVVSAWKNGVKLHENVVRGKLGGTYRSCENPRIVNVFGGVSSASFMANNDMKTACSGQRIVSMDALRSELLGKIAAEVVALPEISEIHSMNM
jgi:hypothetical protein